MGKGNRVFLSYAAENQFEAELLQSVLETGLAHLNVKVWTYKRDQSRDQQDVAGSLKKGVKGSAAVVFLLSPNTGSAQWSELAYADAFGVPTFILLHLTTFSKLKSRNADIPPLVLNSQCTPAVDWKTILKDLRACCTRSANAAKRSETKR